MKFVAAKQRWSSSVKVVFDGNSLFAGYGLTTPSTESTPAQTMARPLMSGPGVTSANVAINGQTWAQMTSSASDVDAAWPVSGKGVLVCWETTNSVNGGRTGAQCFDDCKAYIAARLAVNPWRVVVMTALPRKTTSDKVTALSDFNTLILRNFRDAGAHAVCDVRQPGSPFAFDGSLDASFTATQSLWYETSFWLHTNAAGNAYLAQMLEATLRRLPARS